MFHVVDGKTFKKINSTHFEYIFGYYKSYPLKKNLVLEISKKRDEKEWFAIEILGSKFKSLFFVFNTD